MDSGRGALASCAPSPRCSLFGVRTYVLPRLLALGRIRGGSVARAALRLPMPWSERGFGGESVYDDRTREAVDFAHGRTQTRSRGPTAESRVPSACPRNVRTLRFCRSQAWWWRVGLY